MSTSRVGTVALVACLLATSLVAALPSVPVARAATGCTSEIEPNDTPEQALVPIGPGCVSASLPEGDQDLFTWVLSPGGRAVHVGDRADRRPQHGDHPLAVADQSDAGVDPVVVGSKLLDLSSQPSFGPPPQTGELLLEPGRYLIGVARSGTATGR